MGKKTGLIQPIGPSVGAVGWQPRGRQPTGRMGPIGPSLGLYAGNLLRSLER